MYHYSINYVFFLVKSIAVRIHYLYSIAPEDASLPISYVGNIQHVITSDITLVVQESVFLGGILNSGYSLLCVIGHSLRASGAMALFLNNIGEYLIQNLGDVPVPNGSLTSTHNFPLFTQVFQNQFHSPCLL